MDSASELQPLNYLHTLNAIQAWAVLLGGESVVFYPMSVFRSLITERASLLGQIVAVYLDWVSDGAKEYSPSW